MPCFVGMNPDVPRNHTSHYYAPRMKHAHVFVELLVGNSYPGTNDFTLLYKVGPPNDS
jgi:hypothetical protein